MLGAVSTWAEATRPGEVPVTLSKIPVTGGATRELTDGGGGAGVLVAGGVGVGVGVRVGTAGVGIGVGVAAVAVVRLTLLLLPSDPSTSTPSGPGAGAGGNDAPAARAGVAATLVEPSVANLALAVVLAVLERELVGLTFPNGAGVRDWTDDLPKGDGCPDEANPFAVEGYFVANAETEPMSSRANKVPLGVGETPGEMVSCSIRGGWSGAAPDNPVWAGFAVRFVAITNPTIRTIVHIRQPDRFFFGWGKLEDGKRGIGRTPVKTLVGQ